MHGAWRPTALLVCAALVGGGAVDAAQAGTASGRPAQFMAGPGEGNDLTVAAGSNGSVQFIDAAEPVGASLPWCVPFPLGQALCDPDGDPRDTDGGGVTVDLGDQDDHAAVRFIPGTGSHPGRISVAGGAGSDVLENLAFGSIRLDGGEGDDTVSSGSAAGAYLLGGPGADALVSTGECCAVVGYSDHQATNVGVSVTLDGIANDGLPGERDDVRSNHVIGSFGPDIMSGGAHADTLVGGGGADVIDGGAGDDTINVTLDYAQSGAAPGSVDGVDRVNCGTGTDDVAADANDDIAVDCEHIRVGGAISPQLTLATKSPRADAKGIVKLTYRVKGPGNVAEPGPGRGTVRLVDSEGLGATSSARYTLGARTNVLRLRVRLKQAVRGRLNRTRAGSLRLIAQAVSQGTGGPASFSSGLERFNAPLKVRRIARRR